MSILLTWIRHIFFPSYPEYTKDVPLTWWRDNIIRVSKNPFYDIYDMVVSGSKPPYQAGVLWSIFILISGLFQRKSIILTLFTLLR
jgi:hypothetical protein